MSTGRVGPVRVALVLISHSRAIAEGTAALAGQMAPDVTILAAGGLADGGLGTSFDAIEAAVGAATVDGRGVVVLTDLGSAVLTADAVLELAADDVVARARIADAPFVEGAVAAAVAADGGGGLDDVLAAAEQAASTFRRSGPGSDVRPAMPSAPESAVAGPGAPAVRPGASDAETSGAASDALARSVVLANPLGLHARPAAVLARLMAGFDAQVTVNGVNAASVLELMKLGATGGQSLAVTALGPQAAAALAALVDAVEGGFGEV